MPCGFTIELTPEDDGGCSVFCRELNIVSQGDNEKDALANIHEAIELHLETLSCTK